MGDQPALPSRGTPGPPGGAVLDVGLVIVPFFAVLTATVYPIAQLGGRHTLCPSACIAADTYCGAYRSLDAISSTGLYNLTALGELCTNSIGPGYVNDGLCVANGLDDQPVWCSDITAAFEAYDAATTSALATPLALLGVAALAWASWGCGARITARVLRCIKGENGAGDGAGDGDEDGAGDGTPIPDSAPSFARRVPGCGAVTWLGRLYDRKPGTVAMIAFVLSACIIAIELTVYNNKGAALVCPQWCLQTGNSCSLQPPGTDKSTDHARCCSEGIQGPKVCVNVDDDYSAYAAAWNVLAGVAGGCGGAWITRLLFLWAASCSKRTDWGADVEGGEDALLEAEAAEQWQAGTAGGGYAVRPGGGTQVLPPPGAVRWSIGGGGGAGGHGGTAGYDEDAALAAQLAAEEEEQAAVAAVAARSRAGGNAQRGGVPVPAPRPAQVAAPQPLPILRTADNVDPLAGAEVHDA